MDRKYTKYDLDELDVNILSMLMENASIPYTEIAKKLNVSGGTIDVRMKKMEDLGVVRGSTLLINANKIGFDITAFLGIFLEKGSEYSYVVDQMKKFPEVIEVHYCTGQYSLFAKVLCRDTSHLRTVLNEHIQVIEGVHRTETIISLEESLHRQFTF